MRLRTMLRGVTPPIIATTYRALVERRGGREWTYCPGGWPDEPSDGWGSATIAEVQAARWDVFRDAIRAPQPLTIATETWAMGTDGPWWQESHLAFAHALASCALETPSPSILDWGGALGQGHALARELFPDLDLTYACAELPGTAAVARCISTDVDFPDAETALAGHYDLVIANSSLQYAPEWRALLCRVAATTTAWLYLGRVPCVERAHDYVVIQDARRHGYDASYPGWVVNRAALVDAVAACGLTLRREIPLRETMPVPGAPEQPTHRSLLFRRP